MTGIADVARLAGVSKATASRALSGIGSVSAATRLKVSEAAASLGYTPSTSAVSLATGRTRAIGVLMPNINRWFFGEVLEGIQSALQEAEFDLTLYRLPARGTPGSDLGSLLARKRFDGLITVGLEATDGELDALSRVARPIVGVSGRPGTHRSLVIDEAQATRRATEHLLALGHRAITFLGGPRGEAGAHADRLRRQGYEEAMSEGGLAGLIRHAPSEVTLPGGYASAVDLLADSRHRPTALVSVCDEVAIGAIIAARRLGIPVPGKLSVVGVDDHAYSEMFALTTLAQDPRSQGRRSVELMMHALAHPEEEGEQERWQTRLVVRSSTAPADPARAVAISDTGLRRDRPLDEPSHGIGGRT